MSLKRGDTGPEVTKLQNEVIALGYPLPRWGADGNLGSETLTEVHHLLADHGKVNDPNVDVVDDVELAFIEALYQHSLATPHPPVIIDRRPFTGKNKDMGPREWAKTTGWCLHQTACHLGSSSNIARCDNVGAHFVVYQDGRIFWLHDLNRMIIHGNGWNAQTIGIEIDGLFAGIEGNPSTVWDDPSTPYHEKAMSLTAAQAESVRQLIRWGTGEVKAHGGNITKIVAHRQSSDSRRNDPGSKVWQEIAIPMSAELGCDYGGVGFRLGSGYPIPVEWDPAAVGYKY
jgi:N-acetyl-anhydromuramyl-L-alanine amidase AmpD